MWLHVVTFNKDPLERQGRFTLSTLQGGARAGESQFLSQFKEEPKNYGPLLRAKCTPSSLNAYSFQIFAKSSDTQVEELVEMSKMQENVSQLSVSSGRSLLVMVNMVNIMVPCVCF